MSPWSSFRSLSKWVQLSLISSLLQIFLICTLESLLFIGVNQDRRKLDELKKKIPIPGVSTEVNSMFDRENDNYNALPVYFGLFFFAQIFQFILCCDAAWHQNTVQIFMLAIFNFLLLLYACVQLKQNISAITYFKQLFLDLSPDNFPLEISIIVLLIAFASCFAFLAYKLYQEYGWNIYKRIGADLMLRRMYMIYHVFVMVLKFDILFFISFSAQYIVLVILKPVLSSPLPLFENPDFSGTVKSDFIIHLSLSIAICVIMSALAFKSVKNENKIGMALFGVGCVGVLGYFISKLFVINARPDTPLSDRFSSSRAFLNMFTCLCIFFAIWTIVGSILCYKNFGKGLKDLINRSNQPRALNSRLSFRDNNRWSLD